MSLGLLPLGPKMGVLTLHPIFNFLGPGELPPDGLNLTAYYCGGQAPNTSWYDTTLNNSFSVRSYTINREVNKCHPTVQLHNLVTVIELKHIGI